MKKYCLLIWVILSTGFVYAQNRDNIWMLAYYAGPAPYFSCGINFNSGVADTFTVEEKKMLMYFTNASICDTLGQLLFYTNGLYIANRNHDTLFNSHLFNDGALTDFYVPEGMGIPQGAIILPRPEHPDNYYVFYQTGEYGQFWDKNYGSLYLSMSEVDMTLDGGLGGILSDKKNIHLVDDTLIWGRITACKHANGRDWWLISHKAYSDLYYKFLIQPDTIIGPIGQHIGNEIIIDRNGMACFSPDGSKYAHLSYKDSLDVFDFNRCTGEFSNHVFVPVPDSLNSDGIGCAFSPDGQFLYVNQHYQLHQVDMFAPDMASSIVSIAAIDGWVEPNANIPPWFSSSQLAPDNKIYIATYNSAPVLHQIIQPDSFGDACDFQQHSFQLPSYNVGIPNFPNYDLGPLEGSGCDTLYSNTTAMLQTSLFKIFPNPSNSWLYINYQLNVTADFELYNSLGIRVATVTLYPYFKSRMLDVSNLVSGIYLATIFQGGRKMWSEKIAVQH